MTPLETLTARLADLDPVLLALAAAAAALLLVIAVSLVVRARRRAPGAPPSALAQLAGGLAKTRAALGTAVRRALGHEIDAETLEELEAAMIEADMGVKATGALIEDLREAKREGKAKTAEDFMSLLKTDLKREMKAGGTGIREAAAPPTVILVVGVNGVGKTTSIAKLTHLLKARDKKVLLCAGDTFRAAAVEQLTIWSERLGAGIVKGASGGDPAAVAHDATDAAIARNVDYLIVDTAGRLHTHQNLMAELGKIKRVIRKRLPEAPHEVLLVLDATTGQNAIAQAREFQAATEVTGLFLAKLDGTAKGGIVVAIRRELDIPVKFVGLGETPDAIQPFDADRFVDALFA